MDTMAEVGRIADTAHSGTALVDFIDPVVNLVITLDFAGNALGSDFASEHGGFGGGILGVGQTNDLKGHLRVFGAGDTGDGVQGDGQNDLASLIFQEIQTEFAQNQVALVPVGQKLVLFRTHISLLDDSHTPLTRLVGLGLRKSGAASIREERQVGRPGGRGGAETHLAEGRGRVGGGRGGGQSELWTFGGRRAGSGPGVHELVRSVHAAKK